MGYVAWYWLIDEPFIIQNAILFLVTYGSFLYVFVLPSGRPYTGVPVSRYFRVIQGLILFEGVVGIAQVIIYVMLHGGNFDAGTGDVVQGTLNPISFIADEGNFNNQIYSTNMMVLLLFYAPFVLTQRKGFATLIIGLLAVMLAAVWHVFIGFAAAIGIVAALFSRTLVRFSKQRLLIAVLAVLAFYLVITIQPNNASLVAYYAKKLASFESPKTKVTALSLTRLPKEFPWSVTVGLGPGQYGSRAGLIGSGHYFGDFDNPRKIPLLKPKQSDAFARYTYPLWKEVATNVPKYGNSTMSRPFYSALSLLVELGPVVFSFFMIWMVFKLGRLRRLHRDARARNLPVQMFYAQSCATLICFLAIVSFFENYLEVVQIVFPSILLFIYFYRQVAINGFEDFRQSTAPR